MLVCLRCLEFCGLCCFKQNTAYEMRISDWSSDVCSSDLHKHPGLGLLISLALTAQPFDGLVDNAFIVKVVVRLAGLGRLEHIGPVADRRWRVAQQHLDFSTPGVDMHWKQACAEAIIIAGPTAIVQQIGRAHV